jgi:hypothetical protein
LWLVEVWTGRLWEGLMKKLAQTLCFLASVLLMSASASQARAEGIEGSGKQSSPPGSDIPLDGRRIVNVVDDFLAFWDVAKGKSLSRQRVLWARMVENKNRDYFDKAVYRNTDPDTRREMLDAFLQTVPSRIDNIREFNKRAGETLVDCLTNFRARFPDYQQQRDVYIGPSLFTFDGAVRSVSNDLGVPDTLCLGADVLSGYSQDQLRIAIVHEMFHLYHFNFLFGGLYKLAPNGLIFQQDVMTRLFAAYVPLMVEGMAVAASEQIYPGHPLTMYLHLSPDELDEQQDSINENAQLFLNMMRTGALPNQYEVWFGGDYEGVPRRGGYLLGYEATKRSLSVDKLEDLVRLKPSQLGQEAETQLSAMVTDKLFVLSAFNGR